MPLRHLCTCQLAFPTPPDCSGSSHMLFLALTPPYPPPSLTHTQTNKHLFPLESPNMRLVSDGAERRDDSKAVGVHERVITIESLWLTAAFLSFPFPELYYCAHEIAFNETIAIGYCASCKNPESFFKTNLAFQEIL